MHLNVAIQVETVFLQSRHPFQKTSGQVQDESSINDEKGEFSNMFT